MATVLPLLAGAQHCCCCCCCRRRRCCCCCTSTPKAVPSSPLQFDNAVHTFQVRGRHGRNSLQWAATAVMQTKPAQIAHAVPNPAAVCSPIKPARRLCCRLMRRWRCSSRPTRLRWRAGSPGRGAWAARATAALAAAVRSRMSHSSRCRTCCPARPPRSGGWCEGVGGDGCSIAGVHWQARQFERLHKSGCRCRRAAAQQHAGAVLS